MKHKEADFGTVFRHWVLANGHNLMSCAFELKQTQSALPFSAVEEGQLDHGMAVKWGKKGVLVRVQAGTAGAADYHFYRNAPSYIVIKYPDFFCIIDVETFMEEKKRSQRKSLTPERAKHLAWKVVEL